MEERLIKKIIAGSNITPPEDILICFKNHFPGAINIDWHLKEDLYEAIFYFKEIEHIAHFNHDAQLSNIRKNLPLDRIPEKIYQSASQKGEIMNVVEKNIAGKKNQYEVIFRDHELKRFMALLDEEGLIEEERAL